MDLASARDAGISFFTHKATEGVDWEDRYYKKALDRARSAGIPVLGSYHYLWPDPPRACLPIWWRPHGRG
jgi:GH25 family lysozyme M1 (1,4-beta-N-acetylmuramidase)